MAVDNATLTVFWVAAVAPYSTAWYSNPYAPWLPWASIHVRARLHRLTLSRVAPVVCIQKAGLKARAASLCNAGPAETTVSQPGRA